jgi:hypothetical protein
MFKCQTVRVSTLDEFHQNRYSFGQNICSYSRKKYNKVEKYFDLKGNIQLFYAPCQVSFGAKATDR